MTVNTSLEEAGIPEKVEELKEKAKLEAEERKKRKDEKPQDVTKQLFNTEEEKGEKERKPKKVAPEYIFVFDDMSDSLRDKSISALIKRHRHFKTKVIFSSQYPNDLAKDARKNIDIFILFSGHSEDKLMEVYKNMELKIPFGLFTALYEDATEEPYSFLYVDKGGEYRRTFNEGYFLN